MSILLRSWLPALALLLLAATAAAATPAAQPAATAVVDRLHATLIEAMQNDGADRFEARLDLIEPVVDRSFDFRTIGRAVLGRTWRGLNATQQEEFLKVFSELSSATYAARFAGFSGERFAPAVLNPRDDGYVQVDTRLERPENEPVRFTYLLRQGDDGWRIVNVVADGVSDIALKRADYSSVIKESGFDALLGRLRTQVSELSGNLPGP